MIFVFVIVRSNYNFLGWLKINFNLNCIIYFIALICWFCQLNSSWSLLIMLIEESKNIFFNHVELISQSSYSYDLYSSLVIMSKYSGFVYSSFKIGKYVRFTFTWGELLLLHVFYNKHGYLFGNITFFVKITTQNNFFNPHIFFLLLVAKMLLLFSYNTYIFTCIVVSIFRWYCNSLIALDSFRPHNVVKI